MQGRIRGGTKDLQPTYSVYFHFSMIKRLCDNNKGSWWKQILEEGVEDLYISTLASGVCLIHFPTTEPAHSRHSIFVERE